MWGIQSVMPRKKSDSGPGPANLSRSRQQVVVELYCSSCSFAQFMHSKLRWSAWYICIDRLPRWELEQKYQDWDLAAFLAQPFVIYIQQDLGNFSSGWLMASVPFCPLASSQGRDAACVYELGQ